MRLANEISEAKMKNEQAITYLAYLKAKPKWVVKKTKKQSYIYNRKCLKGSGIRAPVALKME